MKKITYLSIFVILIATTGWFYIGSVRADSKALEGINDTEILPMLKKLPHTHGGMNVPPKDGRFLYDLILKNGYTSCLEIGTSNGYSTLWLGLAMKNTKGKVITIEIDSASGLEAQSNFKKAKLDTIIDSRINNAFSEIPKLTGKFDIIFIDAWKSDYNKYLEQVLPLLKDGGAIVAHNVKTFRNEVKDFLEAIKNNPALETTFPDVSSSGMSVSIKKFRE